MNSRKSIRLPDYDYSQAGEYFITICVNNRLNRLGNIADGKNILSAEGQIVNRWINQLTEKFETISIDDFIIMPNHIHLILEIDFQNKDQPSEIDKEEDFEKWRITRSKMLLPKIINYLKTNSSIEINRLNNEIGNKFWQANYYEHIIRNEKEHLKISSYIENNPITWGEDRFNQPT
jgi:putative transposase